MFGRGEAKGLGKTPTDPTGRLIKKENIRKCVYIRIYIYISINIYVYYIDYICYMFVYMSVKYTYVQRPGTQMTPFVWVRKSRFFWSELHVTIEDAWVPGI